MTLLPEEKDAIIHYRIEKAYQALKEAEQNCELGNWSLTANRLYYASFYMALAVNLFAGESSRTHVGTFNLVSKQYIRTGLLSKEDGNLYRQLFNMRQTGDYDDLFDWEESDVMPIIPAVKELLNRMNKLIER